MPLFTYAIYVNGLYRETVSGYSKEHARNLAIHHAMRIKAMEKGRITIV